MMTKHLIGDLVAEPPLRLRETWKMLATQDNSILWQPVVGLTRARPETAKPREGLSERGRVPGPPMWAAPGLVLCQPCRLTCTEKRRRVEIPPRRSSPDLRARVKIATSC